MSQVMLSALLSLALALGGCHHGIAEKRSLPQPPPTPQDIPPDTLMTLERTMCMGRCPVYKLTISADGKVLYEGREYVKKEGKAEGRISREKLRGLLAAFDRINYFGLSDRYDGSNCPEAPTDSPSAITSLRVNGKEKVVNHYLGCRGIAVAGELTGLEDEIDQAVNVGQWVRQ